MNREEQFEKRLQRQPLGQVPSAWREEILRAAHQTPAIRQLMRAKNGSPWWQEFFWPHPIAWGAIASIWLLILGVNLATREPSQANLGHRTAPPSQQMRELLRQQEQMLAELVGPRESLDADRPKPAAPRSQRREEFLAA
jgi:hypothetical protein